MAAYKYKKKTYPNNIKIIFLIQGRTRGQADKRTGGQVEGWIDRGYFVVAFIQQKAGLFEMIKTRKEKMVKW